MSAVMALLSDHDLLLRLVLVGAIGLTVLSLGLQYVGQADLKRRMKAVALERSAIRERERARMVAEKSDLRYSGNGKLQTLAERLQLDKYLGQESAKEKLVEAGFRAPSAYRTYLATRLIGAVVFFLLALLYQTVISPSDASAITIMLISVAAAYPGLQLPVLLLRNKINKRLAEIRRAFPDALDLILICVEGGMSAEVAFRRVGQEIISQSPALAEELSITTAELSYLSDRRQAFDNLAKRVKLEGVKAVATALMQAERYGTPLAQTLRVLAQENRDMRMSAAEKKAAGLPPKLTVPMIIFFLPCLFVVIVGPAYIRYKLDNTDREVEETTRNTPPKSK